MVYPEAVLLVDRTRMNAQQLIEFLIDRYHEITSNNWKADVKITREKYNS